MRHPWPHRCPTPAGGSPSANVETAPDSGSTRKTLPALPSVTYNAPSGPTVLPEPKPLPNEASSVTSGDGGGRSALAGEAASQRHERDTAGNRTMNLRLIFHLSPDSH